jgi:hypothetical protein
MTSEFQMNDPQNLWQNQPTEAFKMSADKLRRKAQRLDRKARLAVFTSATLAILLSLWFGWGFLSFAKVQTFGLTASETSIVRIGFCVLSLWCLYSGFQTYRVLWPSRATPDADLKTTLQSYKHQLEKRRDYLRNIWRRAGLIWCFLGMAMVVMPMLVRDIAAPLRLLANLGPLFALFILWLAIFIPQRRRRQRKLQQEIDRLRAFEREYQA